VWLWKAIGIQGAKAFPEFTRKADSRPARKPNQSTRGNRRRPARPTDPIIVQQRSGFGTRRVRSRFRFRVRGVVSEEEEIRSRLVQGDSPVYAWSLNVSASPNSLQSPKSVCNVPVRGVLDGEAIPEEGAFEGIFDEAGGKEDREDETALGVRDG